MAPLAKRWHLRRMEDPLATGVATFASTSGSIRHQPLQLFQEILHDDELRLARIGQAVQRTNTQMASVIQSDGVDPAGDGAADQTGHRDETEVPLRRPDAESTRSVDLNGGLTPRWTADGSRVVYRSAGPPYTILTRSADGQGDPHPIAEDESILWPDAVTPDGRTLVLGRSPGDILTMPLDGSSAPRPLTEDEFLTWSLGLSPDGRWLV